MAAEDASGGPWREEVVDLVRAGCGGLLFGIPLLYTVEVWDIGSHTEPEYALLVLAFTFLPVFILNRTSGFRSARDVHLGDALRDTVEAVALGLVLVTCVLVLLREVRPDTPATVALGKIVYEALPFCLGIGVASHLLRRGRDAGDDDDERAARDTGLNATLVDFGATLVGSLFVALNIAATDEVPLLASAMGPAWLVALMAGSLVISYGIVFVAGFAGEAQRRSQKGILQRPSTETAVCYLVSLISAALMLLFFQRRAGVWPVDLGHVIVLGLPAVIGGSAGRLAT